MTRRHRHALIACLAGAIVAIGAAVGLAGFRLVVTFQRTLELFAGDGRDPIPTPELSALALALVGAALLVGAAALAIAGRRSARALERVSLIETSA